MPDRKPFRPPSFDWVIEGRLAAMARPYDLRGALEYLQENGIEVIVTLTESPLRPSLIEEFGIECHHVPVEDFYAPTQRQIAEFVSIVGHARRRGKSVVVHCQAGMGRTGTMLAAYLVSEGRDPEDAIARIRRLRPGSIETPEQEDAVREYGAALRKRK